jgi:hypothetical protein
VPRHYLKAGGNIGPTPRIHLKASSNTSRPGPRHVGRRRRLQYRRRHQAGGLDGQINSGGSPASWVCSPRPCQCPIRLILDPRSAHRKAREAHVQFRRAGAKYAALTGLLFCEECPRAPPSPGPTYRPETVALTTPTTPRFPVVSIVNLPPRSMPSRGSPQIPSRTGAQGEGQLSRLVSFVCCDSCRDDNPGLHDPSWDARSSIKRKRNVFHRR